MSMYEHTIAEDDADVRLDRWFKRHLPQVSQGMLQKALRKKAVRLDGKRAEASTRLQAGQVLKFPSDWKNQKPAPGPVKEGRRGAAINAGAIADLEKCILHEDKHILVLNKPAGLAVQGGTGQKESVDAILTARAMQKGEEAPRLVHRLDRDTSGVLVMGKTAGAAAKLAASFARKKARKLYWALVLGSPRPEEGKIDMALAKKASGKDSRVEKMQADDEDGKDAVTIYRLLERAGNKLSWVELEPVTGRTHQLRVHMAGIGHPILGDGKYGGTEAFLQGEDVPRKLHLHAAVLELPFGGKELRFEAPLPGHMRKSWQYFGFDT